MKDAPLFYREEMPSAEAAHFVLSYWEFRVSAEISAPVTHEVFPDGCVSVVFYRNRKLGFQKSFISQINPKSIYVVVNPSDEMWGIRILPEACAAFLGTSPAEVSNQFVTKETLGARYYPELENQLSQCEDFYQAVKVYENYAKNYGVAADKIDVRLARATRIFIESEGLAKVSETAKQIGLSERQFERNYRQASGLTPKQFARICRFRATAVDLVKNSEQNWASRAADKGFTDQSHLNREFTRLTGNSPSGFSENVKRIEHGKIIE